jgi:ribosomal protein L13E
MHVHGDQVQRGQHLTSQRVLDSKGENMSVGMLDVLSALDANDEPFYSNCTLQMGDVALEFKNGRSKVPEGHAPEVLRNPKVMVPGYTGPAAPLVPTVAAEIATDVRQQRQETPEEIEARGAASEEYLRSQGIAVPQRVRHNPDVERLEAEVQRLRGMLEQGVTLPAADAKPHAEVVKEPDGTTKTVTSTVETIPDGLESLTTDGKPRCWARKGDGTQCSNASIEDSHACGLNAHKQLVK